MLEWASKKMLEIAMLGSLFLCINGCKIDGEEEIEIHADGALNMRLNYQIPERGLSLVEGKAIIAYMQEFSKRHESITVSELSCERAGSSTVRLITDIHSADATQLRGIVEEELELLEKGILQNNSAHLSAELLLKLKAILGDISISVEGLNIEFKRTIRLQDLLKNQVSSSDLLGKYQFRYTLTAPSPATGHNATLTSNNGKTLTWVMPLQKYYNEPFTMQATLPIPIPWWVWLLVCLAIFLMLFMMWKILSYGLRKLKSDG